MEKLLLKLKQLQFWKKNLIAWGSGGAMALAFPDFYLVGVLWIIFPFILFLQSTLQTRKQSFLLGFCFGAGLFFSSMFWVYHPLTLMEGRLLWMIPLALCGVSVWGGAFIGAVFYGITFFHGKFLKILTFACLWTVFEYIRSNFIFGGIAWNILATVWAGHIEVAQIDSVIGSYLLTFLTVFMASLPFGKSKKYIFTSAFIVLALFWFGKMRLANNPTEYTDVTFKIVQPNISQEQKYYEYDRYKIFDTLVKLSKTKEKTDYTIWAETAFPFVQKIDETTILPIDFNLISGVMRWQKNQKDFDIFNSAMVLEKGKVIFVYDKIHLVPFGEYVPLAEFLPIDKIVPGQKNITQGNKKEYFYINGVGNVAISICYEIIFSGELKVNKNKNLDLMINLTNDKWFGDTMAPYQHLASSVIRAIEEGLPIIRATNSGISAVIDPVGRIINKTKVETVDVLVNKFPKKIKKDTIFSVYENAITFGGVGVVIIFILGFYRYRF